MQLELLIQNGPFSRDTGRQCLGYNLSDILIIDNQITGHANAGIITSHAASMTISNNTIENNGSGTGLIGWYSSVSPWSNIYINNMTIDNNIDGILPEAVIQTFNSKQYNRKPLKQLITLMGSKNTTVSFNYITNQVLEIMMSRVVLSLSSQWLKPFK